MKLRRAFLGMGAVLALTGGGVTVDGWKAFGHRAEGSRRARMEQSPQWRDGHFVNPQPLRNDALGSLAGMFEASPDTSPAAPLPSFAADPARLATPPPSGLRVTWFGHSSILIELDGRRVLADPVFSDRASPLEWLGPRRWYPPPIALAALPPVDAVVI